MDSFVFDNVKVEKAKAMESYNRRRTLKNFMLLFELCLGLVTISWLLSCFFIWIPVAVRISGGHLLHLLSASLSSNLCVFVFCNAIIVLIAFLSSSGRNNASGTTTDASPDLYDEFVTASEARRRIHTVPTVPSPEPEDKHVVCSENEVALVQPLTVAEVTEHVEKTEQVKSETISDVKHYRRTQSDNFGTEIVEKKTGKELRRSETENGRKLVRYNREMARKCAAMEDLSSEEFKLKIEAFIAAQKCIQRKERKCMAIAVSE